MEFVNENIALRTRHPCGDCFPGVGPDNRPSGRQIPKIIRFLGYSPYSFRRSLHERLKTYRKARGLSQKKLAKRLNVDPGTLARWESGRSRPMKDQLDRIEALCRPTTMTP